MIKSITPNPGGILPPEQVVGRDRLIARYWEILQRQSLALLAPRRIGKSSICRRMAAQPADGFHTHIRDLQSQESALDFARVLFEDVEAMLHTSTRTLRRARTFWERLTGAVEVKGVRVELKEQDWRLFLEAIFADLQDWAEQTDSIPLLIWDEFTLFIGDMERNGRAREAMLLLDLLRAVRQRHDRVRMLFTGSIGLEEVIQALKSHGYANDPVNDMSKQVVPLLEAEQAAQEALEGMIEEAVDPLELSHYQERLESYLSADERRLALAVLDALAPLTTPQSVGEILAMVEGSDRELLLDVLRILHRDLYLVSRRGRYRFRMGFLQRYWLLTRGLV